ncbi:MAG: hypothetical protein Q4D42_00875 [Eubacteriales bacterium]|nr:hypothetical protein [Eubacteriales bacterium]
MSKKERKKREADGIWVSDERRITDECKQVYPAIYRMQRFILGITIVVWIVELLTPTVFNRFLPSYASWGGVYENVMLVLALVMLVVYIIANYFWQKKMQLFREKYELQKYKQQQKAAKRKREGK